MSSIYGDKWLACCQSAIYAGISPLDAKQVHTCAARAFFGDPGRFFRSTLTIGISAGRLPRPAAFPEVFVLLRSSGMKIFLACTPKGREGIRSWKFFGTNTILPQSSINNPQSQISPFVSSFVSRKRNSPGGSRSSVVTRNDRLGFYQCGPHQAPGNYHTGYLGLPCTGCS